MSVPSQQNKANAWSSLVVIAPCVLEEHITKFIILQVPTQNKWAPGQEREKGSSWNVSMCYIFSGQY